jgi:tetratricopeptide (TPR) repeat protein
MGVVYRATDTVLDREVAVKVLDGRFDGGSAAARRFIDEARVTGQLQHPSIPAVHDLGSLPDGRPFLAMKLIKGRTLDRHLKQRPDAAHDRGQFIAIFEQVCQAVGFAHDHQVLHRDLKPANVMVGSFGEVQVMDWGLAKVLGAGSRALAGHPDPEATAGTEIRTARESDAAFTQAGTMLGTPAYMPPEQAGGEIDRIDERADVFGLGALLAVILTGQPPYVGKDSESIRLMAVRGQLADCLGRLDRCGAEPGLVALAKRCLAYDPAGRPRNAEVVAMEVAALRAAAEQRARVAEREQAKAEGQAAEARKKRRVQLALAALAVLVTVGAAVAWSIDQRRRTTALAEVTARRERTAASVTAALDEARARTTEAWGLTAYPDRMTVASDFATAAVRRAEGFMATGEPTDELRAEMGAVRAEVDDLDRHARLFAALTRIHAEHADRPNAGSAEARAQTDRQMADAFRAFGLDVRGQSKDEVAAAVLAGRARDKLLGFLAYRRYATGDPVERERLNAVLRTACHSAGGLLVRWQDVSDRNDVPALLKLAASPEVMTLGIEILDDLHRQLEGSGRVREYLEFLRRACDRYPDFIWFHYSLSALCLRPRPLTPEAVLHAAVMPVVRPNSPFCHYWLGRCLLQAESHSQAVRSLRKSIELKPSYVSPHAFLGTFLVSGKDLSGVDPADLEAIRTQPRYARTHVIRGRVLRAKGDLRGAVAAYKEALRLDPRLGLAPFDEGNGPREPADLDVAVAQFRAVTSLDRDPNLAEDYLRVGADLRSKGDLDGAEFAFRERARLAPKLAAVHLDLGLVLKAKGDLDGAEVTFREMTKQLPTAPLGHANLGIVLYDKGDYAGAAACYREAIRLAPNGVWFRAEQGMILRAGGDLAGAVAACREAVRLGAKLPRAHYELGASLQAQGDLDGAAAEFREAIRLEPNYAIARNNLQLTERWRALLPRLPDIAAGTAEPATPLEGCEFAVLCAQPFQKHNAAAVRLYRKAFAAAPELADDLAAFHRYNAACCAALAGCGNGADVPPQPQERIAHRRQALAWLRADQALMQKKLASGKPEDRAWVARQLSHWLVDPDLAGMRPASDRKDWTREESAEWDQFWARIHAMRDEARKPPARPEKSR